MTADFNGDSKLDFAAGGAASGSSVWTNTGPTGSSDLAGVSLFPASVDFGNSAVGGSAPRHVTLSNNGSRTLNLHNITVLGNFSQQNNCGAGMLAGSTCTFTLVFRPESNGIASGLLALTDNGPGTNQSVLLTGYGTP